MIPRHRPPFRAFSVFGAGLRGMMGPCTVRRLEKDFETSLSVNHAIWLPSARYGITRSVQFATPHNGTVFCSAFNCGAVFHAAQETRRDVQFVDCGAGSFLMDLNAIRAVDSSAVILSEMFGHRFDADQLSCLAPVSQGLRVFDLAMGIPTSKDLDRMRENDVTVASFGLGKSLYAGWGGMAFTNCDDLADSLRRSLSEDVKPLSEVKKLRACAEVFARTAAHQPSIYRMLRRPPSEATRKSVPEFCSKSHEWNRPPTQFHLRLLRRNLSAVESIVAKKRELAAIYSERLSGVCDCGEASDMRHEALSHFSIRVLREQRSRIQQQLWHHGIGVGTLFPFPSHVANVSEFPEASRIADEVLNLPLSPQLKSLQVSRICDVIQQAVAGTSRTGQLRAA